MFGRTSKRKPRRLRNRPHSTATLIVAAFGAGLGSILLLAKPSVTVPTSAPEPVKVVTDLDVVQIPTPSRAIAKGERLADVPFTKTSWPRNRVSESFIQDLDRYTSAVAITPLPKHLPVPISAVSLGVIDSNEVVEGIPEGMRAITVRVDAESAVEGWARSGNNVDVIVVRAAVDSSVGLESKVIAENVRILSAGQSTTPLTSSASAPPAPATVTLLVSQEDALKIKTAAQIGKLTFALRGKGDGSPTLTVAMSQKRLLGGGSDIPAQPKTEFKGFARDAEGRTYVLADEARWVRSELATGRFQKPAAAGLQSSNPAQRESDVAEPKIAEPKPQ